MPLHLRCIQSLCFKNIFVCIVGLYLFILVTDLFIFIGNECCERLAYYGMSSNLVRYFKYHLNEHSSTASRNLSAWTGTCYLTPLIGAFMADTYLGRYWTIATFSIIYAFVSIMIQWKCVFTFTISFV